MVGPIIALLEGRPEFVVKNSVVSVHSFMACDIPGALTKIDLACGQHIELSSFRSCTEIHERVSSELESKNVELCGSAEKIETRFHLDRPRA
jgi:hypothetical protein